MRLHEYIRSMQRAQQIEFAKWQRDHNQQIYQLKKATVTEKRNSEQQHLFESQIVTLHREFKND